MTSDFPIPQKTDLKTLNKEQLLAFCKHLGLPRFRADQIFQWLYQKGVSSFDELHARLAELSAQIVDAGIEHRFD